MELPRLQVLYDGYRSKGLEVVAIESNRESDRAKAFIEKAPFLVLATVGPEGVDCSPRGDPAGFVRVVDSKTLMLPDRKGNNRLDSLRNIVRQRRVSLLFLIPGVGETLRVNGHADIVVNAELNASFEIQGKQPRSVIVVTIDRVYFQCQKALARSRLWDPQARIDRTELPSSGEMLQAVSKQVFDGAEYDAGYSEHMKRTIY